jgi:hypothetical protein
VEWYDYYLWFYLVLIALGSFVNIATVGRVRPAASGTLVAVLTVVNILTCLALYLELTS